MFNKKSMVLVCGGAPSMAPNTPASPGAGGGVGESSGGNNNDGGGVSVPKASGLFSERPRPLIGGGPRAGPLRALIGPWEGSQRALIGCDAEGEGEQPKWRPASLPLPEGELDGCEEAEEEEAATVPSSTPSPDKEMAEEEGEKGKGGPPLFPDHLRKTTLEVVGRYLREAADEAGSKGTGPKFSFQGLLGRFGSSPNEAEVARALETLRRVGESLREKHLLAFQGMLRKLEIKKEEDLASVAEVTTEVFRDGIINWGRIVTLISFGAFVAKHLKSINQENAINTLIEIITDVLVTDKREWLLKHNAWQRARLGSATLRIHLEAVTLVFLNFQVQAVFVRHGFLGSERGKQQHNCV
uniref:Bcl-2 Bcl-2 homology region 1-3 domain-containing protein n=1 Tax=Anolis carolinensis TaxID=28377 RepID=R4GAJ0_ANOCA